MDILAERRAMMRANAPEPKPLYIGGPSGSNSYIQLPVNPSSKTVIEIEWYGKFIKHPSGGYTGILVWNNSNAYGLTWESDYSLYFYIKSWNGARITNLYSGSNPVIKTIMDYPTKTVTTEQKNGTVKSSTATVGYSTSSSYKLYAKINQNHKFHKISIKKNGVLTHEFVAAEDENAKPCLKDTLTGECYYDPNDLAELYTL
jgi:uncharacterized protein YxeA